MRDTQNTGKLFDKQLGMRLRTIREIKRWSLSDLAKRLGISYQQIQKYETGVNSIPVERLDKCAKIFGVPVSYFFASEYQDELFAMTKKQLQTLYALNELPCDNVVFQFYQLATAITECCEGQSRAA